MSRGSWVILSMLLAAAAAGGSAVWFHHQQTKNVRAAIGAAGASHIANATDALLTRLQRDPSLQDSGIASVVLADKTHYSVNRSVNIGQSRGYINLRAALLKDASYDWDRVIHEVDSSADFDYALTFGDSLSGMTFFFDLHNQWMGVYRLDRQFKYVSIAPIADGLRKFFEEQFATPVAPTAETSALKPAEN